MNEDQRFGLIIAFGIVLPLAFGFGYPLLKAFIRRMERGSAPDGLPGAELEEMRQRLGEVEELRHRVAELEERVDFSERLLAQADQQERLKS